MKNSVCCAGRSLSPAARETGWGEGGDSEIAIAVCPLPRPLSRAAGEGRNLKSGAVVLLAALALFSPVITSAAPPTSVKATYEMYRNNMLFARVEETFVSENGKYHIESSASPEGLLTLLSKDRITRLSKGSVTKEGLRPDFFEEKRTSGEKEKVRSAQFDWSHRKITLTFDGNTKTLALPQGTQDWSSLFYQFLFSTPAKDSVKATVTDGKRVESYVYRFADEMNVTTAAGKFETRHYVYSDEKNEKRTEIWLAKEKSFFPVRLIQEEGGNVLEQRLVALNLD